MILKVQIILKMSPILAKIFLCDLYVLSAFLGMIKGKATVSDEEYASMPSLFHLDNFDKCNLLGKNAMYCSITVQLTPMNPTNYSDVWKIINNVISHDSNYRHDRLRHGICVPESCPLLANISNYKNDYNYLKNAISNCYLEKNRNLGLKSFVTHLHCETTDPFYSIDVYDVLVGIFLIVLLTVVIFASFYETLAGHKIKSNKYTSTTFGEIISCFSLRQNWKRLGSKNTKSDANYLRCINGIRFYNMLMVILTHTCMVCFIGPISNPQFIENITDNALNMLLLNGSFAIQTFFVMAGLLLSYHFFLTFDGRTKMKFSYIFIAFINRYIRLTPCLLVMVAISGTWLYHLDGGPSWDKIVGDEYRNCRENWWTNLLYINNYYNSEHICMQQSWYLAADTQLFVLALAILIFMWKYQKHIKIILGTTLIVGVSIPGIINYIYDYDILIRQYPESLYNVLLDNPQWHMIYTSGYTNIGGYTIGLIFGYILYKYRQQEVFTKTRYVVIWWMLTWGLPLSMVFVGVPMYSETYEHARFGAAVYVSLARNVFALGIAIGVFGISQGIGWFLRDAIIWSPLQVLGRLTYCVYLVHVALIRVRAGQARSPIYLSNYGIFIQTFGDLVIAYMFAAILCLFVEMPISALQKLFMPQLEANRDCISKQECIIGPVPTDNILIDGHFVTKL